MTFPVRDQRPLVVHVVYRFDVGSLENGVVNLINSMTGWRHAVVEMTEALPAFCVRVQRDDVLFKPWAMDAAPGCFAAVS